EGEVPAEPVGRVPQAADRLGRSLALPSGPHPSWLMGHCQGKSMSKSAEAGAGAGCSTTGAADAKRPFDIDLAMDRIREAVRPFPKAALFELAEEGFRSPFEQLAACIISIRTRDEVTLPTARRLFELARTPEQVSRLTPEAIDERIRMSSFHEAKARQIL